MASKNYEKLIDAIGNHRPFISYDVESTGVMNGNDNRITQIAMASYKYNNDSRRYELQDSIFMLAKPNEDVLRNILVKEVPNEKNATEILIEEFVYKEKRKLESIIKAKRRTQDEKDDAKERLEKLISEPSILVDTNECRDYVKSNIAMKMGELNDAPKLGEILKLQGIDINEWRSTKNGLSSEEMQRGIDEFLKKYDSNETVFVSNGTYYSAHYLRKEEMILPKDNEQIIDMTQAMRSRGYGSTWTSNISDFTKQYREQTGKTIKTFDALTKTLCLSQIAGASMNETVSHNSVNHLAERVKEASFKEDTGYVMSLARASSMHWNIGTSVEWEICDYHFNSQEYVQFGNDKRYVDVDKMFEMNDNFQITLEGDKEPIKSWEELENKIKSMNADVSDYLMKKIKSKYEEMSSFAEKQKELDNPVYDRNHTVLSSEDVRTYKILEKMNDKIDRLESKLNEYEMVIEKQSKVIEKLADMLDGDSINLIKENKIKRRRSRGM